ncbi:MAG: RNA 3'-phosphate cyclase [Deltaproteobacteria bacterium]|nr:RNA 3'-phosphate cyclase [Deltaproteobacteria bacterium]
MLHLDGSYGEGGGQILRTALSLAATLEQPVHIVNIRVGRAKPGLRPQHLTGVLALARITNAEVTGAELHSRELTFRPRRSQPGRYLFDVAEKTGSAGSVTLLAQALLPPLIAADQPSSLTLRGGTHVAWSPPAHYLLYVFLPALAQLGAKVEMTLNRWGWYPRGGGEVGLEIHPAPKLAGVEWRTPPEFQAFRALSAASRLPEHVRRRQGERLQARLGKDLPVDFIEAGGLDPGSMVFLYGPRAGFDGLGARGKPAEKVADEAADAFLAFRDRKAAVDRHLADQIVLYLARARGPSSFITPEITLHLLTNLWVIEQFLGPTFEVKGELGERGEVGCH